MLVPLEVTENYKIGSSFKIEKIECGLANNTYLVSTDKKEFILQRLHEIYSPEVVIDLDAVSRFINANGGDDIVAQKVIRTKNGKLWIETDGRIWRLLSYITGMVYEKIGSANVAFEAGRILGKFHHIMNKFEYKFKNPRPPAHDSRNIYRMFIETVIRVNGSDVESLVKKVRQMPQLMDLNMKCQTVAHGDPKISNIIFNENGSRAVGLIDLDGCMPNYLLLELGDAFRSWCGRYEDDPNNQFNLDVFRWAFRGYIEQVCGLIDRQELSQLIKAIKLITLELASRFLRDYFLDKYFAWDKTRYSSRKEHNLARTVGQIALYDDIERKENKIFQLINTHRYN